MPNAFFLLSSSGPSTGPEPPVL